MKSWNSIKYYLFFVFLGMGIVQLYNLSAPIVESYGFRQTQTAISVFWSLKEGFNIAYQTPVLGWPWQIPFEFPTYQFIVYFVVKTFNIESLGAAGRVVSMCFHYAAFFPLYLILKRLGTDRFTRLLILLVVTSSVGMAFWSRTFLIESTALFFGIMALQQALEYEFHKKILSPRIGFIFLFAALAALSKITTFLVIVLFLFFYVLLNYKPREFFQKKIVILAIVMLLAMGIGKSWLTYADSYKVQNPIGINISSARLKSWHIIGSLYDRVDPETYDKMYKHIRQNFSSFLLIFLLPTFWKRNYPQRKLVAVCFLTFSTTALFLVNLYKVHTYYWYANGLFFAIPVGIILATELRNYKKSWAFHALLVFFLLFSAREYYKKGFQFHNHVVKENPELQRYLKIGKVIRENTDPSQIIYVKGLGWSSEVPYFAQRKSIAIPTWVKFDYHSPEFAGLLEKSTEQPLGALVMCGLKPDEIRKRLEYFNFNSTAAYSQNCCNVFLQQGDRSKDKEENWEICGVEKPDEK